MVIMANKNDSFNNFMKWISFGGNNVIAENDRVEHRKFIKYNPFGSKLLIFQNVYSITRILHELAEEGYDVDAELLC